MDAMVIVGAGEAGTAAAVGLREGGWDGPIVLIGDEPHAPYERPPLSKAAMTSVGDPAPTAIAAAARFAEFGIAHLAGAEVSAIDRAGRVVRLADGRWRTYERLLLATGAAPRRLAVPGGERALVLRSFDHALALRPHFAPGRSVAIVGGGFIGLELAASARERGAEVTVVEAAPRILMRGVPAVLADVIADRHRAAGVRLLTGIGIAAIEEEGGRHAVVLADGRRIAADCVVAGIGAVPNTTLASAAGLRLDNGIAVDGTLRTSDPGIFAAGDCCSFPHPLYGGRRLRLEAWRNAQEQGAAAARAMLGSSEAYAAVPWFWSDQYDLHLQIAGLPDEGATVVERDPGQGGRLLFHLTPDGRLAGASGLGPIGAIARDLRIAEMLIARSARPDPATLASPAAKLKALLTA
jgi:3-phenylpropionate/trans-cinnamate dioxygenase ferredoxin reductase subunit